MHGQAPNTIRHTSLFEPEREFMQALKTSRASRQKALRATFRGTVHSALSCAIFFSAVGLSSGCRSSNSSPRPSIRFEQVPPAQAGGPALLDQIKGTVLAGKPGMRIVVYAHGDNLWWVQPFRSHEFTDVGSDGSWETATHLGTDYAALLVGPGYRPPAKLTTLPAVGNNILAVAMTHGSSGPRIEPHTLQFSGYQWRVLSSASFNGGELCDNSASNSWVDKQGYLHLVMGPDGDQWHCAGVALPRSLGYGTYRFVISESTPLPPSAALVMFIRDDRQDSDDRIDMDIELSRWGKASHSNADFVVQPYYIPQNTVTFNVPAGLMTYVLQWEPGTAEFRATKGAMMSPGADVMDHVFTSGIPVPADETVHLALYDFQHSRSGLRHPVEILVQRFEYVP